MRAFETGQPVEDILVSDSELGYVGTVFAPVLDAGGRSVALMGADVSMHEVQEELRAFLLKSLGLSVGTVFVLVFLYLVYLKRRVVDQIGKLTQSVNAYAQDSGNLVYSDARFTPAMRSSNYPTPLPTWPVRWRATCATWRR